MWFRVLLPVMKRAYEHALETPLKAEYGGFARIAGLSELRSGPHGISP
jgi:hypothetical protein